MAKYYAISEHGNTRERFEITNKQTGKFKTNSKKTIPNETPDAEAKYNKLTMLRIETVAGNAVIEKIGIIKTLNFTINDCDPESIKQLFATTIRHYGNKKEFLTETFEVPLFLEFAYPGAELKKKINRKLSFDEMIKLPIDFDD